MGTEDVKVTAINMYKYKEMFVYTNVGRVALIFLSVVFVKYISGRFLTGPHYFLFNVS